MVGAVTRSDGDIPLVAESSTGAATSGPLERRQLLRLAGRAGVAAWGLGLGVSAGVTLSGCTGTGSGPKPGPSGSGPASAATPTPLPLPGTEAAAETEAALADFADRVLLHAKKLTGQQKRLLGLIRDAHRAHVVVLSSTTPFDLPATPAPTSSASFGPSASAPQQPTASRQPSGSATTLGSASASPTVSVPSDAGKAIKKLIKLEAGAAIDHRKRSSADDGPADMLRRLALLWGSLSAAATCYKTALSHHLKPHSKLVATERIAYELPATGTAVSHALEQTYALIFGYQTAIAHLSGDAATRARTSLSDYRDLRDHLSALIVAAQQKPPSPHPAYKLPVQPSTASRAADLAGRMETAMLPYLGQWLATAKDRRAPLDALTTTATAAQAWTATIAVWPGWPTS